jgi:uncharacterized membrane protein
MILWIVFVLPPLVLVLLAAVAWLLARGVRTDRELAALRRDLADLRARTITPLPPVPSAEPAASVAPDSDAHPVALPPTPVVSDPRPLAIPVASVDELDESAGVFERAIGEQWLLYAGVVLLLLAIVFFLRYAFERDWLSPSVRVLCGVVAGGVLAVGGRRLAFAGFRSYGLSLAGAGFAVLYLSVYAALAYYGLIGPTLAFGVLVIISAAAAWSADVAVSLPLAVVAVIGGFATPFLVGGRQDAQVVLFTYDAVLIAATVWLASRRRWWALDVLALALTILTVAAWAAEYYTPAKGLRTELFLAIYCGMFLLAMREGLRAASADALPAVRALIAAPILYHLASIALLYQHPEPFLAYLILASTAAALVADRANLPALRGIAWLAVTVPLAQWLSAFDAAPFAAVVTVLAVYAVFLASSLQALHARAWSPSVDTLLADANGLAVFAELSIVLSDRELSHLALVATLLAAWNVGVAVFLRRWHRGRALHWAGVAATLLAMAVAIAFNGPWVVVMWGVEGAVLLALAIRATSGRAMSAAEASDDGRSAPAIDPLLLATGGWVLLLIAVLRWAGADIQQADPAARVLFNQRALSGLLLIGLFYALAVYEGPSADHDSRRRAQRAALFVWASALTVAVISREIDAWAVAGAATDIVRQAMLSGAWALYAAVAIAAGIRRQYRPIRYFGIALFALTLAKVFAIDLGTLTGIDRIIAFLVIGIVLLFASFLYQRGRVVPSHREQGAREGREGSI